MTSEERPSYSPTESPKKKFSSSLSSNTFSSAFSFDNYFTAILYFVFGLYFLLSNNSFSAVFFEYYKIFLLFTLSFLYLLTCICWSYYSFKKSKVFDICNLLDEEHLKKKYLPFLRVDTQKFTLFKTLIGAIFLMTWRLPLFAFSLSSSLLITLTLSTMQTYFSPNKETFLYKFFKFFLQFFGRLHAKIGLLLFGVIKIREHDLREENEQCEKIQSKNIISNHVSCLDILYYMSSLYPSFIAKESLAFDWAIGCNARVMDCVFVKRNDTEDREKVLQLVMERQKKVDEDKNNSQSPFIIFPEGTTTNGLNVIQFKRGAFVSGLPLQPIVLIYSSNYFIPSFEIIPMKVFLGLLLSNIAIVQLDVYFLPVIFPPTDSNAQTQSPLTQEKYTLYAKQAREKMSEAFIKFHPLASKIGVKDWLKEFNGTYRLKSEIENFLPRFIEQKKRKKELEKEE